MISFTDVAKEKVLEYMQAEGQESLALRIAINGRGAGGFQTELHFVGEDEKNDDDTVIESGGFKVYVDAKSAESLNGAKVDFVESLTQSGFKVENPNPVWTDNTAVAVQDVIDNKINPGVASHGGFVTLLDVKDDTAFIALGGGCQGCGMADVTLKQGIEVMIKEAVPQITKIMDTTDHAGGSNPYYQPSKGGDPALS
jgi:Fe/S biogenesis protein NfuA